MKINYGLILATMLSTSVMAQVTNTAPPMPPMPTPTADTTVAPPPLPVPPDASTNKPPGRTKKPKKKKSTAKAAEKKEKLASINSTPAMPVAPFTAGQLAEAKQDHVNIRGQANINSEVIGHLKKGETVTVLEEVTLKHPKADEPAHWARIALPSDRHVWVNSSFIDASNQVVRARKLNLRTGAGENYSVAGLLHKGDPIKTINSKGSWSEIEAPTNSFAFVAAHLLKAKEAGSATPEPPPVPPAPPVPTIVGNQNNITPATGVPGAGAHEPVPTTAPAVPLPPIPAPAAPAVSDEPLPKRIVDREGVVGGTFSIQAPTYFELRSLENGHVMDYLYTTSTNVVLKNYKGLTIHVSGEEELDERWPNTPVLTIQRIQVVK